MGTAALLTSSTTFSSSYIWTFLVDDFLRMGGFSYAYLKLPISSYSSANGVLGGNY